MNRAHLRFTDLRGKRYIQAYRHVMRNGRRGTKILRSFGKLTPESYLKGYRFVSIYNALLDLIRLYEHLVLTRFIETPLDKRGPDLIYAVFGQDLSIPLIDNLWREFGLD